MNLNIEYDVFIAFHDSAGSDGALAQAESIYAYLQNNGLKCFLFPQDSNSSIYKANFIKIMQSRLFLMVCNDKLFRKSSGELDYKKNYHLYVEVDTFFALTQSDDTFKSINDSAVLYFTDSPSRKIDQSPETLHPLFNNRNSFFIARSTEDEDTYEDVLDWALERLESYDTSDISNELVTILTGRGSDALNRSIEGINFKRAVRHATMIKCIGISNWTFSLTDGCDKLLKGLKRGTKFEMLFLDPDGECTKIRAEEEQKDTKSQILASFDMMKSELSSHFKQHPEKLENLETYTYDMLPRDNLIFIYTEKEAYVFVQSYSHALPGSACPCKILRRSREKESPLFEYYENIYANVKSNKKTNKLNLVSFEAGD